MKQNLVSKNTVTYIPEIDGLRALAVLAVIFYHMNPNWLPGGFIGVDVFFVISGFIVSATQVQNGRESIFDFVLNFYARRIRRLVPALFVFLVLTALLSTLFFPRIPQSSVSSETLLAGFWAFSNWVLLHTGQDYFLPQIEFNPAAHLWSLGLEEQFYILFPFVFYFWSRTTSLSRQNYFSLILFGLPFFISFVLAAWFSGSNSILVFYSICTRFWELGLGVLIYQMTEMKNFSLRWPAFQQILVLGILTSGFFIVEWKNFPWPWAAWPALGTAWFLILIRCSDKKYFSLLANPIFVFIGKISYSLYLWHWIVFVFFRWTWGLESAIVFTGAFVLSFLLAIISYYWIEKTFRYSFRANHFSSKTVVIAGIGLMGLGYFASDFIIQNQRKISLSVTARNFADWYPDLAMAAGPCRTEVKNETAGTVQFLRIRPYQCQQALSTQKLIAVGDSQVGDYTPLFQKLVAETGIEVLSYQKPGCPYLRLLTPNSQAFGACRSFFTEVDHILQTQLGSQDILFLTSLRLMPYTTAWNHFSKESVQKVMGPQGESDRQKSVQEAIQFLQTLPIEKIKVIFEAPKPLFKSPPFRCADVFNYMNPICEPGLEVSRDELMSNREPILKSISNIAQHVKNIHIWDPFPALCPDSICRAFTADGRPLFFDGNHLSALGGRVIYPDFKKRILEIAGNKGK